MTAALAAGATNTDICLSALTCDTRYTAEVAENASKILELAGLSSNYGNRDCFSVWS